MERLLQGLRRTTAPSIYTAGNTAETENIHTICKVLGLLHPEGVNIAIH
jgi:hypothetical protein